MQAAIVVGTTGSVQDDHRVLSAAREARHRQVPLHVVCCVRKLDAVAQRGIDRSLPADLSWCAGDAGQREAAMREVRSMLGGEGLELHVSATTQKLEHALREVARRHEASVYGADIRRVRVRRPLFGQRVRATA